MKLSIGETRILSGSRQIGKTFCRNGQDQTEFFWHLVGLVEPFVGLESIPLGLGGIDKDFCRFPLGLDWIGANFCSVEQNYFGSGWDWRNFWFNVLQDWPGLVWIPLWVGRIGQDGSKFFWEWLGLLKLSTGWAICQSGWDEAFYRRGQNGWEL